ncbi:UDP-diphosphatase [Candidatus Omnitrophus magneticus]|uniref:Undecaprenyl-diphosphatase n=1 Tax=Candidatus Omnitrophus magneticus TaxID=1609969 RepID=A0A0F0CL20_9BACT|nr:UDP-diphosphatase [Candidatus Omnitrophus magneticus]
MSILQVIISGIVQGITEFLPISSDGHLAILHGYFKLTQTDLFFDVCLHIGTLFSVLIFFRKRILELIQKKDLKYFLYLSLGTVPAVIAGLLFEKNISSFYDNAVIVSLSLFFTGSMLFVGQFFLSETYRGKRGVNFLDSIVVGIMQAIALLPGVSRSGMTISTALIRKIKAEEAFNFSFLLSVPAVLAAVIYETFKVLKGVEPILNPAWNYILGIIISFLVGLVSLPLLARVINGRKLYLFGIYCFIIGGVAFFLLK